MSEEQLVEDIDIQLNLGADIKQELKRLKICTSLM